MTEVKRVYGVGIRSTGEFKSTENGKHTKLYTLWKNMLARCYSEVMHKHRPTYKDCTVEGDFLDFQKFCSWYTNQVLCHDTEYQLDKDLLIKGNKVYSEDTCLLVPRKVNMFLCKSEAVRGKYKIGVSYDKNYGMYRSQVSNSKEKTIEYFTTEMAAYANYKNAKEDIAKRLAKQFEDKCDIRVIDALNSYEVQETD